MLLFMLFAGCTLMIIAVAAGAYSRISSNFDKTFGASAAVRYLSNKIRASEQAKVIENGTGIILQSGEMVNVIYFSDGTLYEKSISSDSEPTAEGGERIFDLFDMGITESDNFYTISVSTNDEELETIVRRG